MQGAKVSGGQQVNDTHDCHRVLWLLSSSKVSSAQAKTWPALAVIPLPNGRHPDMATLRSWRRWKLSRSSSGGEGTEIYDAAKNTHLVKVLA
jgi:hypothetical protein